jgi:acetyl-CoA acetyltransferase
MTTDVAIVGLGLHAFGRHDPDLTGLQMGAFAARQALVDAGLTWDRVDYAVGGSNVSGKPDSLVADLGLTGVPFVTVRNGCATGGVALLTAANAIRAGEADIALVVGFDKHERGAFSTSAAAYGHGEWYARAGMLVTPQFFAMKARRYLHDHGLDDELLALAAEKAFRNGELTPTAWRRKPLSAAEIADAFPVAPPLTQFMLCSPSEGAAAIVLARAELADELCEQPVRLRSVAMRTRTFGSLEVFSSWLSPGPLVSPSVHAAAAAFAKAGVSASDVDVAQVQDTDSGSEIIHLAETGLCVDGEQGDLIRGHELDLDGSLPINTDGGCLANGEPIGASGLRQVHEVALQLQGRAEERQVANQPRIGFTHVYGAPGLSACTVLSA